LAAHPYRSTAAVLGLNAVAAATFALAAAWLLGDPAEPFRELAPLTWLSFAELAFVATAAWAIHLRVDSDRRTRWADFWSLSALFFVVFALDELTQATIFLSHAVEQVGAVAPGGFHDLDAFLLTVLFLAAGAGLARYAPQILRHPRAVAVLSVGVALGAASQVLDSTQQVTTSAIVLEESLKLAAEPFLLGGYLVVLHRVMRSGWDDQIAPPGDV
jgi:hypothetical protein